MSAPPGSKIPAPFLLQKFGFWRRSVRRFFPRSSLLDRSQRWEFCVMIDVLHCSYFIVIVLDRFFALQKESLILDAPNMRDDFFRNTMNWSSGNTLAAALGSALFTWNASSKEIKPVLPSRCVVHRCYTMPSQELQTCPAFSQRVSISSVACFEFGCYCFSCGSTSALE